LGLLHAFYQTAYTAAIKLIVANKLHRQWKTIEMYIFFFFQAVYAAGRKMAIRNTLLKGSQK